MADLPKVQNTGRTVGTMQISGPDVDVTRAGVWEWDLSAHCWIWDAQTYALYGIDPQERGSLYERWRGCLCPEDEVRVLKALSDALAGQAEFSCRFHIFRQGEVREMASTARILRHSRGDLLVGFVHDVTGCPSDVHRDILEGGQWEQSRLAAHYARDAVVITDGHARIEWVNPSFETLTGYSLSEGFGRTPGELLVGDDTDPQTRARILTAIASGQPTREEILYYKKDGTPFWGELNVQNVIKPDGAGTRTVGILRDITDRRQLREELSRQNALLGEVTRVAEVGPWEFNSTTQSFDWTSVTYDIFGWSEIDPPTLDQFLGLLDEASRDCLQGVFSGSPCEDGIEHVVRLPSLDDTGRWIAIRGRWLNIASDHPRLIGSAQCVTQEREREGRLRAREQEANARVETLSQAQAHAQAVNQARNRFATMLSHEMRTPLNGVLGALQVIRNTTDPDRVDGLVDLAETACHQLSQLIIQILDYAEIDDEGLLLSPKTCDLLLLLRTVWEREQSRDPDPDRYEMDTQDLENVWVKVDPDRLVQMISALLGNARKHAPDGPIVFKASRHDGEEGALVLRLDIQDSGSGIAPDQFEAAFQPFVQLHPHMEGGCEGAGLGLALAQKIAEAYKGQITLHDAPEGGLLVQVNLVLERSQNPAIERANASVTGRRRASAELAERQVLVVDDNALTLIVLRELLESAGAHVVTVSNGEDAIAQAKDSAFDAVFMDIRMPNMSGYQVCEAIHTQSSKNASVPIFALTADAQVGVRKAAKAAGMRDVLLKPVARETLVDALLDLPFRPMEKVAS
ncbi:response regulator [Woodsholea maritima]|uniref:response regulator n=1 Tax=Woodsholea maritima TaxID=240237 RepID=UPI00035D6035|nr:response regulator [Woodsholea maritima]